MYLTCDFIKKYYLVVKSPELEEIVVGPSDLLQGPYSESPDPDAVYELPDPEEFMISPPED